jgi:hypothetical protein
MEDLAARLSEMEKIAWSLHEFPELDYARCEHVHKIIEMIDLLNYFVFVMKGVQKSKGWLGARPLQEISSQWRKLLRALPPPPKLPDPWVQDLSLSPLPSSSSSTPQAVESVPSLKVTCAVE